MVDLQSRLQTILRIEHEEKQTWFIAIFLNVFIGYVRVGYSCCVIEMRLFDEYGQVTTSWLPTESLGKKRDEFEWTERMIYSALAAIGSENRGSR